MCSGLIAYSAYEPPRVCMWWKAAMRSPCLKDVTCSPTAEMNIHGRVSEVQIRRCWVLRVGRVGSLRLLSPRRSVGLDWMYKRHLHVTIPAMSSPWFVFAQRAGSHSGRFQSLGLEPLTRTRVRISCGPGTGVGVCVMRTVGPGETSASSIFGDGEGGGFGDFEKCIGW